MLLNRLHLCLLQDTAHQPVAVIAEGLGPNQTPAQKRPLQHTVPVPIERPPEKRQAVAQIGFGGLQEPSSLTAQVAPQPPLMGPPTGLPYARNQSLPHLDIQGYF